MPNTVIIFHIRDEKNQVALHRVNVTGTFGHEPGEYDGGDPHITEWAVDYAALLDSLIQGQIFKITFAVEMLTADIAVHSFKAVPGTHSDVEEGLQMTWRSGAGGKYSTSLRIPTFNEGYYVSPGSDIELDPTDTDIALLIEMLRLPVDLPGGYSAQPADGRWDDLHSLKTAREDFSKRKR